MENKLKPYIVLTLIALVFILLIAFVLYERMVVSVEKAAFDVVEATIEANVNYINAHLDEIERLGHSISNNTIIATFFMQDYFTDVQLIMEMNRIIMPFISWVDSTNKPLLDSIRFITDNRRIVHNSHIFPKYTHNMAEWFEYIEANNAWRTQHWVTAQMRGRVSSMYMLVGQTREITTILELSIDNYDLFARVNGLFPYDNFFVEDKNGHIIYQRGSLGLMQAPNNGMAYHTTSRDIERLGFVITMVTPLGDIVQPAADFRSTFILILMLVLLIFTLILYMLSRIKRLTDKNYLAEIAHKRSVIDSLQKQIKPHFIYNTIETFKMMAEINGHEKLSDALTSFGGLIRYTMLHGSSSVTLGMELENLWDYICVQNLLKNDLLELYHEVEGILLDTPIPVLILQPLAENAILHGYDHKRKLQINIHCQLEENCAVITFSNNGKKIPEERLTEIREKLQAMMTESIIEKNQDGIALVNIHNRIRLQYGAEYGLCIDNLTDGVAVTIRLPNARPKGGENV